MHLFDRAPRAFGEKLAGKCQRDPACSPIEETVTEHLFEPLDLLAEWRLGNAQALRRLAEME